MNRVENNVHNYDVTYYGVDKYTKISGGTGGYYLIYKVPYANLKHREIFSVENRFIVYILCGRNKVTGKNILYVGESKNGIDNRPTSHEKGQEWDVCYILTTEKKKTFLNEGVIKHLENEINLRVNSLKSVYDNFTQKTSANTANERDELESEKFLRSIYEMLDVLGLNLYEKPQIDLFMREDGLEINKKKDIANKECYEQEVIGYTLNKKQYPFESWRMMIVDFCEVAIRMYGKTIFRAMAQNKKNIPWKNCEQFRNEKPIKLVNCYKKLSDGTYVYVNFSREQAEKRILKLQEVFTDVNLKISYREL